MPCTPAGIIELLDDRGVEIRGANACVVGRSQIVGRPMAQLLLQRDATVTICHSRTRDLAAVTRTADLLVVAIGRAGFIGRDHIKPGATVIDVGMNKVSDVDEVRRLFGDEAEKRLEVVAKRGSTLVGDVNPAEAAEVAGMLTPVPGGVGLLTVAMLMKNTLKAAKLDDGSDLNVTRRGLTGSIGVGKSFVASVFVELGCHVLDADQTAREVVMPGTPGLKALTEAFGEEILESGRHARIENNSVRWFLMMRVSVSV